MFSLRSKDEFDVPMNLWWTSRRSWCEKDGFASTIVSIFSRKEADLPYSVSELYTVESTALYALSLDQAMSSIDREMKGI
jgi:hypothetical protein